MPYSDKKTKFCKHCGKKILYEAVVCVNCGLQVEELKQNERIIINNSAPHSSTYGFTPKRKNKWVALSLCLFLGILGGHKFYEEKFGTGFLYILTCGLFGFGVIIDFIKILFAKNPYYIYD